MKLAIKHFQSCKILTPGNFKPHHNKKSLLNNPIWFLCRVYAKQWGEFLLQLWIEWQAELEHLKLQPIYLGSHSKSSTEKRYKSALQKNSKQPQPIAIWWYCRWPARIQWISIRVFEWEKRTFYHWTSQRQKTKPFENGGKLFWSI